MDKKLQTTTTYNTNAHAFAVKFDALDARVNEIRETFSLMSKKNPNVLEIGCGNGRDAEEIVKYTNNYLGIDISEKLIDLACKKVPQATFEVADIENYTFPKNLDIVFAFASLVHVPKESFQTIFAKLFESLNSEGVVRLSLKQSDSYREVTSEDELGVRTFYHYSLQDIKDITNGFIFVKNELHTLGEQSWLEIILKKE